MDIKNFASDHRLKTSVDTCGETVIKGKQGQIYQYSNSTLATVFMPDEQNKRPERSFTRKWSTLRDACVAVGMTLRQQGDFEGALTFDAGDKAQIKLALKVAGVRPKRMISPELAAAAAARFAAARAGRLNRSISIA